MNINKFTGKRLRGSKSNKIKTADIVNAKQNTNSRGFNDRLTIGVAGEVIVKEFLIKNGYNYIDCTRNSKMLSLSEIKAYEHDEIDLIVESRLDDKQKTVEVKTFSKRIEPSSNLCIKVSTQYLDADEKLKREDDAYLYRTKAEYLFFVCYNTKNIYSIKTSDLRDYIEDANNQVYYKTFLDNVDENTRYTRYNKCAYVNVKDMQDKKLLNLMTKYKK